MSTTELIPIIDYLRVNLTLYEPHLKTIRDLYRQILNVPNDLAIPDDPDESAITEVARQLNLRVDTNESRDYLRECVRYEDISNAELAVSGKLAIELQPLNEWTISPVISPLFSRQLSSDATDDVTILADVNCSLDIKMRNVELDEFIHSFLLQESEELRQPHIHVTKAAATFPNGQHFLLANNCILYQFVRQQLRTHGIVTILGLRNSAGFRLNEPMGLADEFGTWHYDHWRGLFDLELTPHGTKDRFPARWRLADNANIYCCLYYSDSTTKRSAKSFSNQPRTASLEVFVRDVCAYEENGQSGAWLDALVSEDILTFEHLANLRESEWDNIRRLTMNAKKILKAAIDRERQGATSEQHQQRSNNFDKDNIEIVHDAAKGSSYSRSELLADLHLIKLFILYKLCRDQSLPKLDINCLNRAFDEMREEGFADDGLFSKMRKFFLPLTISERELYAERGLDTQKHRTLLTYRDKLCTDIERRTTETEKQTNIFWQHNDQITLLEKGLSVAKADYLHSRSIITSDANIESQQQRQAELLQQLDLKWHKEETMLLTTIRDIQNLKIETGKLITELDQQLDEDKAHLENIQGELAKPRKHIGKQLVKPGRGLIVYGPPGTGKSVIISKLAMKLGIVMVGPPLAAGELNRPLVGESERILMSLCERCHRIPYAMCCVSIDEIDSLVPKRSDNTSAYKVDMLSIILSLIEGIKDVPNLMFFCATNRFHMIDEAFLRRMSGKFFVGRPSSDARISILKRIPDWALQPQILDHLSNATTNFTGAAVSAFTRAIAVKCIDAQRYQPKYQVDYAEALRIADRVAQEYQIFFGSETLPRLLLRNLPKQLTDSRIRIHQLSNNFNYTGRIIIDLHNRHVRIEVCKQCTDIKNDQLSVVEHRLHPNETNVQALLERLTGYGKSRNVQLLQLIDLNLLASQSAYDERRVLETLKDRYDECTAYARSMIIYDLDTLIGVNKSESDSSMGQSTSASIVNSYVYTCIRARFHDCAIEDQQRQGIDTIERWAVAVIREPFLLRQFCTDVGFTRTHEEEHEIELERRKAEDLLKCVKCKNVYIEKENRMGTCIHHDGFVYDNSMADLAIHTQSQAAMILNKLEHAAINQPERRVWFETQRSKFKWICCDAVFVNGNVGGCKSGKHGFNVANGNQQQQQRFASVRSDQLDEETIYQWESVCRTNEEYNNKWLQLLMKYK